MDKNVRELADFMTAYCEKTRKSTTGCPGRDDAGCDACMAKGLSAAGYIKPSPSEFKVIGDEEIQKAAGYEVCRNYYEEAQLFNMATCVAKAQLAADLKALQYYQSQDIEQGIKKILNDPNNYEHHEYHVGDEFAPIPCDDSFLDISKVMTQLLLLFNSQQQKVAGENHPRIVCLCGSTRFTAEMLMAEWEYAKQGILAFGWFVRPIAEGEQDHHLAEKEGVHELFDELHKRKIDLADEVLILNVGGYIGESTKSELEYAKAHGKTIRYLHPELVK